MIVDKDKLSKTLGTDLTIDNITLSPADYQIMISENDDSENIVENETSSNDDEVFEKDFEIARTSIIDIIESGHVVLESAENIASQTEMPKTVEAFSALVTNLTNASLALVEIHKKKKELKNKNKEQSQDANKNAGNVTTNNIAFIGSPSELRKFLQNPDDTKLPDKQ